MPPTNTLRQRQQQRRQRAGTNTPTMPAQHLEFVADETYNPPLMGILRSTGRFVKVAARGNTSGMSATWQIFDELGTPQIVSLGDVVMADLSRIPPTVEQLESILSHLKFQE
jgi:hypothetical protein